MYGFTTSVWEHLDPEEGRVEHSALLGSGELELGSCFRQVLAV